MNDPHVIPTNFYIPPEMADHSWIFVAGPRRVRIRACGPRKIEMEIHVMQDIPDSAQGFTMEQLENPDSFIAMIKSRELDWMQESVEHLRFLCEQ